MRTALQTLATYLLAFVSTSALASAPSSSQLTNLLGSAPNPRAIHTASIEENNTIAVSNDLAMKGQLGEAIKKLQTAQASARSPFYDQALAMLFEQSDQQAKAIEHYKAAIAKNANFGLAHRSLAIALYRSSQPDYQIAAAHFASAYENGHRSKRDLNFMGQCYLNLSKFAEAEAIFKKALEQDANDSRIKAFLSYALKAQGKSSEAAQYE
ncbi:MAG: hypothetical protein AAGB46_18000 [Verrucomicrobiota bacterium]